MWCFYSLSLITTVIKENIFKKYEINSVYKNNNNDIYTNSAMKIFFLMDYDPEIIYPFQEYLDNIFNLLYLELFLQSEHHKIM